MPEERVTAILKANDVSATIEWYSRLGFEERGRAPREDPSWCELARDGVVIQFMSGDEAPWPGSPAFTGCLYVYPQSVDLVFEQTREHVAPAWGPQDREWGTRELGFRDPNGYFIAFTEAAG